MNLFCLPPSAKVKLDWDHARPRTSIYIRPSVEHLLYVEDRGWSEHIALRQ